MILADTSIWIDHFRTGDAQLTHLLESEQVLCHPFIIGELACGNLPERAKLLSLLAELPSAPVASPSEILQFIENKTLYGQGIGYVDVHLLAATALAGDAMLWSRDKRLARVANNLELSYA